VANPLAVSESFRSFVLDQLTDVGEIVARSMFGGVGLYADGLFFGIIAGDVLYLKADEQTRARVESAGGRPFKPYPHRPGTMQYYSVPVSVLESAPELARWARQAVAAARRAPAVKARSSTRQTTSKKKKRA
jgi:DNA transformation protein